MPRIRIHIEVSELQDAITQLESGKSFTSPSHLYAELALTNWARAMGATPQMFYMRVKEVNTNPDYPVIVMRTKSARQVGPQEPGAPRRRSRVEIDPGEFQYEIDQLEAQQQFSSPSKLYEALTQTVWGQSLEVSPTMFYQRVKELNIDPANPVIVMKVKPARNAGPRVPGGRRAKVTESSIKDFDTLVDTFQRRGIEVDNIEWLMTSSQKSDAENRAIRLAWADLRDKLRLPKAIKKSVDPTSQVMVPSPVLLTMVEPIVENPVFEGQVFEEQVFEEQVPEGQVFEEPVFEGSIIENPVNGESIVEEPIIDEPVTVLEEMPDGGLVVIPNVISVESMILPSPPSPPIPSVPPSPPIPIDPSWAPVPPPVRVTPSRPMPVKSLVPPRSLPR